MASLCGKWPIERVVLFGSKARGDDDPVSDIDLLLITDEELDRSAEDVMQEEAWQTGMRHGRCVQLVVRSHERWYHGIDQSTPLRLQIDADGVEVRRCFRMTGEEARDRTVAGLLALARECLAEAKYALDGVFTGSPGHGPAAILASRLRSIWNSSNLASCPRSARHP